MGDVALWHYGVDLLLNAKSKMEKMYVACTYSPKKVVDCGRPTNEPPPKYVQVLVPRTHEADLTWQNGLYR